MLLQMALHTTLRYLPSDIVKTPPPQQTQVWFFTVYCQSHHMASMQQARVWSQQPGYGYNSRGLVTTAKFGHAF